jgi:RNA 3'-terminal phosphate cyclase (ATP)
MITVDGSIMEGGGQLLRMATAYSAILGEPFTIHSVRAGRSQPGLRPQHLTTLRAAAELTGAEVRGAELGSTKLTFKPRGIRGGSYRFDIGTAGSVTLLLQCLVPIAAYADRRVELRVIGGTAVKWSPPTPFLENVVWRAFGSMGLSCSLEVRRHGFYPKGGGEAVATVKPIDALKPFIPEHEPIGVVYGVSLCGRLPRHVAERQAASAAETLEASGLKSKVSVTHLEGAETPYSPGSLVCLWADHMFLGSDSLGERGRPAERVGREAAAGLVEQIRTGATVDLHTSDHMILLCSLAEGESRLSTSRLTLHTLTAVELAKSFTGAEFSVQGREGRPSTISCVGVGHTRG